MRLLLDSHVVVWWLRDDPTLPEEIKERIERDPDVRISVATLWELAVKEAAGKISAPPGFPELIRGVGFDIIDIGVEHTIRAARLPLIHRDPFDRVLVAQAQIEGLTLVTRDSHIRSYDVDLLVV